MTSSLVKFATEASVPKLEEHHLPVPHWMFGALAFGLFLLLLGILWTFRNTAARQREGAEGETEH